MSKKEILAYAITHAPPGVKGGPYEAKRGGYGDQSATLKGAAQWRGERDRGPDEEDLELARMMRDEVRWLRPDARVIRIVRARPRPSEASAVEVLRELVAWDDQPRGEIRPFAPIIDRARRVLAASGPDPMPVVRAAMRYLDYGPDGRLGPAWVGFREACEAYRAAVDAYRTLAALDDEYQAAVAATKGEGE